jgi:hypothetical protein
MFDEHLIWLPCSLPLMEPYSSVWWWLRLGGLASILGAGNDLFCVTRSRPVVGPTQAAVCCVMRPFAWHKATRARSLELAEMKNPWSYTSTTSYVVITTCLIKHMEGWPSPCDVLFITLVFVGHYTGWAKHRCAAVGSRIGSSGDRNECTVFTVTISDGSDSRGMWQR